MAKLTLLENTWSLWAHYPQDNDWSAQSYNKIYDFNSVEATIAITETIPEGVIKSSMLFLMKSGILPIWEDPKNRNGGCFSYKVNNKFVVDVWKDLTYVLVGKTISNDVKFLNAISGITISPKKNFCIIKIWMENCDNQNPLSVTNEIKNLSPNGCIFKKHVPTY
jgi:hypothetical protein